MSRSRPKSWRFLFRGIEWREYSFIKEKLLRILTALDRSESPEGMDLPGFRLHALKDRMKGHYAVSVSTNWRVTFRFEEGHAVDADYIDYH